MQDTYRYHGHSISDPGSTYRTRDEIQGIRRARDPIDHVRTLLLEHDFADAGELKRLEKELKKVLPILAHILRQYSFKMRLAPGAPSMVILSFPLSLVYN